MVFNFVHKIQGNRTQCDGVCVFGGAWPVNHPFFQMFGIWVVFGFWVTPPLSIPSLSNHASTLAYVGTKSVAVECSTARSVRS